MQIAAIKMDGSWTVAHPHGRAGRFATAPDALQAAARLAADARGKGHDVGLFLHADNGQLVRVEPGDPRLRGG
ncbi:MAG TPA: hypothetical protein VF699_14125 [Caulobacteraceae bacterium]|jgi:hypothetical protein